MHHFFLKTLLELKESRRSKKLTKFEMLRFEVVDYIDSLVRWAFLFYIPALVCTTSCKWNFPNMLILSKLCLSPCGTLFLSLPIFSLRILKVITKKTKKNPHLFFNRSVEIGYELTNLLWLLRQCWGRSGCKWQNKVKSLYPNLCWSVLLMKLYRCQVWYPVHFGNCFGEQPIADTVLEAAL